MLTKQLTSLLFLFFLFTAFAPSLTLANIFTENFRLRGALNTSYVVIQTEKSHNDNVYGLGVHSMFTFRFPSLPSLEAGISSEAYMATLGEKLFYSVSKTAVEGKGMVRASSFGPILRSTLPGIVPFGEGKFSYYAYAGYSWSLQVIKLSDFEIEEGDFEDKFKFAYLSRGPVLSFGIENMARARDAYPLYMEISYNYQKAYRIKLVDATRYTQVITIESDTVKQRIIGHVISFHIGATLF